MLCHGDFVEAGMSATPHRWHHRSLGHRAASFAASLVIVILLLLALLNIASNPLAPKPQSSDMAVFDLPAPAPPKAEKSNEPEKAASPVVTPPVPKPVPKLPVPPKPAPTMITVSPSEFAALDIGKLKTPSGGASGSKGTYGPGEGPGGRGLLAADWYVEPRNGELAAYLPNGAPDGSWAMIACRTAPKYRVENCVGLGESSPGLARALRQASWQFQVLPPRIDGKPQIGVWVRIRFDFTERRRD
jgi:hypothetical protein